MVLTKGWRDAVDITVTRQSSKDAPFPEHSHDFYEFFVVIHGKAEHVVNGQTQHVERGSLVFIRPSDVHKFIYSGDFEFFNVNIMPEIIARANSLFDGELQNLMVGSAPHHVKLGEPQLHYMSRYLGDFNTLKTVRERRLLLVRTFTYACYQLLTCPQFDKKKALPVWLISTLDQLDKPQNFIKGLTFLWETLNYSHEHINREFKRCLNTTPTKYINELRLRYALRLFQTSDKTVSDICEQCGFNNLNYFYSEFKLYFGFTPKKSRDCAGDSFMNMDAFSNINHINGIR